MWQGSDAHQLRGEGDAFDIACPTGTQTRNIFPWGPPTTVAWYGVAPTNCGGQFDLFGRVPDDYVDDKLHPGDFVHFRMCHLSGRAPGEFPLSGNTGVNPDGTPSSTGPHVHGKLWINDVEVRFETLRWSRDIYAA